DLTPFGISKAMESVELIEQWVAAVRKAAAALADKGQLPGWEWDIGRAGNRKWKDEKVVADIFKRRYEMSDKEMYHRKLISPADAEKIFAETSQKRWEDLQEFIVRGEPSKKLVRAGTAKNPQGSMLDDFTNLIGA